MSYNPQRDYAPEASSGGRPERKEFCGKCRSVITVQPSLPELCWCCWSGHPIITRPKFNLTGHPNYIRQKVVEESKMAAKVARKAAREVLEEAMPDA